MIAALAQIAAPALTALAPLRALAPRVLPLLATGLLLVILCALWLRLDWLGDRAARLEAERARLVDLVTAQEVALEQRAAALAMLSGVVEDQRALAATLAVGREEVLDASPDLDGPVAPVLRRALERLREPRP